MMDNARARHSSLALVSGAGAMRILESPMMPIAPCRPPPPPPSAGQWTTTARAAFCVCLCRTLRHAPLPELSRNQRAKLPHPDRVFWYPKGATKLIPARLQPDPRASRQNVQIDQLYCAQTIGPYAFTLVNPTMLGCLSSYLR